MERLDVRIDGSITFDRDVQFYGVITGSLTVPKGRTVELHGKVDRDLIVEPGGVAVVYGAVAGTVKNKGGNVRVFGVVGSVMDYDGKRPTDLSSQTIARRTA